MKKPNHECIYLIPGSYDGEPCYVWSDDPAPGTEDNPEDAVKYVRADLFNALAAQVELLRQVTPNMLTKAHFNEAGSIIISGYVGGYSLVTSLYQAMFDAAIKELTPAKCLDEIKVQAGRDGFIAGVNETGQGYNGEHGLSDDKIIDLAELYVTRKLRQSAKDGA